MPVGRQTGQSSSSAKRKEDVTEKVREIKQRQQNWLVQREQSKQKDSPSNKNKSTAPHPLKPSARIVSAPKSSIASSHQPASLTAKPLKHEQGKKKVSDTFNNWRKARENHLSDEDHETNSIRSGAESELERLVSPDIETAKAPIAEEEFGSLANKIASRVKQDLGLLESYASSDTASLTEVFSQDSSQTSSRCKTYTQQYPAFDHFGDSGLASHHCFKCKSLMFSSTHVPMMIIPCGHTICKACSDRMTQCPECNCSVVSLTVNIMLQQVIHEYHSHCSQGSSTTLRKPGSGKRSDKNSAPHKDCVEDNQRNNTVSYQSQLTNLQTRQSVLLEEHSLLRGKHGKLATQIQHISSQTKSIVEQEHEIKKTIVDLQDRLAALESHRKQYESQLSDFHDEKSETEGKITLLSGTLSSLTRELEKVKLLAEGEQTM